MEQTVAQQALNFAVAAAFGAGLGVCYDFLRGLRRNLRLLTPLLDGLFACLLLAGNLLYAFFVGGGVYRFADLLGEAAGFALWYFTLGRLFCPLCVAIWRFVTLPARAAGRFFEKIFRKSRKK